MNHILLPSTPVFSAKLLGVLASVQTLRQELLEKMSLHHEELVKKAPRYGDPTDCWEVPKKWGYPKMVGLMGFNGI